MRPMWLSSCWMIWASVPPEPLVGQLPCQRWTSWLKAGFATITSIRLRSVRRLDKHLKQGATITLEIPVRLWRQQPHFQVIPECCLIAWHRWPRCSDSMVIVPAHSANGMKPHHGRSAFPGLMRAGRRCKVSISFTAS